MQKILILLGMLLGSSALQAAKSYQVDLIIFAHSKEAASPSGVLASAETIEAKKPGPYALLPSKYSHLQDSYYQLHRRSEYQVLAHYVWRQPMSSRSMQILPLINYQGWQVQGEVQVRRGTYYEWQAKLLCSAPSAPETTFKVTQKQRLKSNLTYYLDNPQIGMLVRINPVA